MLCETTTVPDELFHGTSSANALDILRGEGIRGYEDRGEGIDQGVSTTTIYEVARRFAEAMASGDDGDSVPVVLVINGRQMVQDGYRIIPWMNSTGRSANEREWRIIGPMMPKSYITDIYIDDRYMDVNDGLRRLQQMAQGAPDHP